MDVSLRMRFKAWCTQQTASISLILVAHSGSRTKQSTAQQGQVAWSVMGTRDTSTAGLPLLLNIISRGGHYGSERSRVGGKVETTVAKGRLGITDLRK